MTKSMNSADLEPTNILFGKSNATEHKIVSGMSLQTRSEKSLGLCQVHNDKTSEYGVAKIVEPFVDAASISHRPIIQSPVDANKPHPTINQPCSINSNRLDEAFDINKHHNRNFFDLSVQHMNCLLENPRERQIYERDSFDIKTIEEENIAFIPTPERQQNSTMGIRGAVAKKDIPAGSPLVYSAQYLTENEWYNSIVMLAVHLNDELELDMDTAVRDAQHRLTSYAGRPKEFQSSLLYTPAYGAGNAAVMVNHDSTFFNMTAINLPTLDKCGNKTPNIWMYFALRDIPCGQQLLINYGKNYDFSPVETGSYEL